MTLTPRPHWFPFLLLVPLSGVLMGLNAPGYGTNLVGLFAYLPLLLVLERIHRTPHFHWKAKLGRSIAACGIVGVMGAILGTPWIIHSMNIYGHIPFPLAVLFGGLTYGLEVTLVLLVTLVLPLFFIRRWNGWDLLPRLFYFVLADYYYPRVFRWSFGGLSFAGVPALEQVADLVGDWGLGLFSMGCNFCLLMLWRRWQAPASISLKFCRVVSVAYLVLMEGALAYGLWRFETLQPRLTEGSALQVLALQPNFSLGELASNPALAYSERHANIQTLLSDSAQALKKFPEFPGIPRLLVWPESTFPAAYLQDPIAQRLLQNFVRKHQTWLLFQTIDWSDESPPRFYGTALLLDPEGQIQARYNKIFLIPFGEYVPLGDLFPFYRHWLHQTIPNMSEFAAGQEYTVMKLGPELPLSATICFDAFSPQILGEMVRQGAQFIVNLSNLAWFGKTNATHHMEMALRWHSIANRVPVLYISNSGETMFLDALGQPSSEPLPLFSEGALSHTVHFSTHPSIYRDYQAWIRGGYFLLWLFFLFLAIRQGRIFHSETELLRSHP